MTERPILFSGPMVQAILDGRKTQTRRIVKKPFWQGGIWRMLDDGRTFCDDAGSGPVDQWCPNGKPGDRLWVRESYCPYYFDGGKHGYRADWNARAMKGFAPEPRWTPSIHMRRAHSRLTLEISEVRVQRLQDITVQDICDEGIDNPTAETMWGKRWWVDAPKVALMPTQYAFQELWESIHGEGAWDSNPWVWAVSFKRVDKEASDGR